MIIPYYTEVYLAGLFLVKENPGGRGKHSLTRGRDTGRQPGESRIRRRDRPRIGVRGRRWGPAVVPTEVGVSHQKDWIPACAGMTMIASTSGARRLSQQGWTDSSTESGSPWGVGSARFSQRRRFIVAALGLKGLFRPTGLTTVPDRGLLFAGSKIRSRVPKG